MRTITRTYRIRQNKSMNLKYDLVANESSSSDQPILNAIIKNFVIRLTTLYNHHPFFMKFYLKHDKTPALCSYLLGLLARKSILSQRRIEQTKFILRQMSISRHERLKQQQPCCFDKADPKNANPRLSLDEINILWEKLGENIN